MAALAAVESGMGATSFRAGLRPNREMIAADGTGNPTTCDFT
jgi:hypothetical protein